MTAPIEIQSHHKQYSYENKIVPGKWSIRIKVRKPFQGYWKDHKKVIEAATEKDAFAIEQRAVLLIRDAFIKTPTLDIESVFARLWTSPLPSLPAVQDIPKATEGVTAVAEAYLDATLERNIRDATKDAAKAFIGSFVDWSAGRQLDWAKAIKTYLLVITERKNAGRYSVKTANFHINAINRMCSWAFEQKQVDVHVKLETFSGGKLNTSEEKNKTVTDSDLESIFDRIETLKTKTLIRTWKNCKWQMLPCSEQIDLRPWLRAFVCLGAYEGLRIGETQGLKWSCVYLDAKTPYIRVTHQVTVREKYTEVKAEGFSDKVVLTDATIDALKTLKKISKSEWVFGVPAYTIESDNKATLLTARKSREGEPALIDRKAVSGWMHHITRDTAEGSHGNYHAFRHYCATTLLDAGVPLPVVQNRLRHRNPATTLEYFQKSQVRTSEATAVFNKRKVG